MTQNTHLNFIFLWFSKKKHWHFFTFWFFLHYLLWLLNQSRFRPLKHLKMIIWTKFLWKMEHIYGKKWPEMVKYWKMQLSFIVNQSIYRVHTMIIEEISRDNVDLWKQDCSFGKAFIQLCRIGSTFTKQPPPTRLRRH